MREKDIYLKSKSLWKNAGITLDYDSFIINLGYLDNLSKIKKSTISNFEKIIESAENVKIKHYKLYEAYQKFSSCWFNHCLKKEMPNETNIDQYLMHVVIGENRLAFMNNEERSIRYHIEIASGLYSTFEREKEKIKCTVSRDEYYLGKVVKDNLTKTELFKRYIKNENELNKGIGFNYLDAELFLLSGLAFPDTSSLNKLYKDALLYVSSDRPCDFNLVKRIKNLLKTEKKVSKLYDISVLDSKEKSSARLAKISL